MTKEKPPIVISEESFLQNVVRLAKARGITLSGIQAVTGIHPSGLVEKNLARNPTFRNLDRQKAEAVMKLAAPEELHGELRELKGYPAEAPEPGIDKFVVRLVQQHKEMGGAWGKSFGELYRFNRSQKPVGNRRGQKYLSIAGCADGIMSTASLSEVENGHTKVVASKGFALIGKLGYAQDEKGLETFVRDTARMFSAYEVRRRKFSGALQAHMYPEGKTTAFKSSASGVTQPHIVAAIKCSAGYVTELLNGTAVPTEAQAEAIIGLFGYHPLREAKFYDDANLEHDNRHVPKLKMGRPPLPSMQVFGEDVRLVREELGIERTALAAYLSSAENTGVESGIKLLDHLESGQRRTPLPGPIKSRILGGLGCESGAQLHAQAEAVRSVERLRDGHFLKGLRTVLEQERGDNSGYAAAETLLETKHASGNGHVVPSEVRRILKGLMLTEAQFYDAAGVAISEEQAEACDVAATLVEAFEQRRTSLHRYRRADPARIGRQRS